MRFYKSKSQNPRSNVYKIEDDGLKMHELKNHQVIFQNKFKKKYLVYSHLY